MKIAGSIDVVGYINEATLLPEAEAPTDNLRPGRLWFSTSGVLYVCSSVSDGVGNWKPLDNVDARMLTNAGALQGTDYIHVQRGAVMYHTRFSELAAAMPAPVSAVTKITANTTLGLTHVGKWLECDTTAADLTLTIPLQATVAFPDNVVIEGDQYNTGKIKIVGISGVTLKYSSSVKPNTMGKDSVWGLKRKRLNEWLLYGHLEAA